MAACARVLASKRVCRLSAAVEGQCKGQGKRRRVNDVPYESMSTRVRKDLPIHVTTFFVFFCVQFFLSHFFLLVFQFFIFNSSL